MIKMEKLQHPSCVFLCHFSLLLLLQTSSPHLLFSEGNTPHQYFINCGSEANVTFPARTFIGDINSADSTYFFTKDGSRAVSESGQSTNPSLNQTARIFLRKFFYNFRVDAKGTYILRLHFNPLSSSSSPPTDFSEALFAVSASGSPLIQNFTAQTVIKEFLLNDLDVDRFEIYFIPYQEKPLAFAFVNAIEFFPAPLNIGHSATQISSKGTERLELKVMLSQIMRPIYRVNVGGASILADEGDLLWRSWLPNTSFVGNLSTVKNAREYGSDQKLNFFHGGADHYTAPENVYRTALQMNKDDSSDAKFNISWHFNASKSASHLVRFHFCDIVSHYSYDVTFDLFVFRGFAQTINPNYNTSSGGTAAPFYVDLVVDSDASGALSVGIGPRNDYGSKTAFLNGIEIMEMMGGLVLVPPTSGPPSGDKKTHPPLSVVLGSVLGSLAFVSALAAVCFVALNRFRKQEPVKNAAWPPLQPPLAYERKSSSSFCPSPTLSLNLGLRLPLPAILSATNNFDEKLLIGRGGFGKVYRGTLRDGRRVAVKRSDPELHQGRSEFQTEVLVLSKIRHRHLVSLVAYCDEGSEMILVYEFMERGTLRGLLYGRSRLPCFFSWERRLEACIGAARGLHYLHTGPATGIVHRDVKSSNILIDGGFVAKVADFGLSKLLPSGGESHVSTTVKGSIGYFDPEYLRTQQLTEKSDVYSFGVVLLEALCGRPAIEPLRPPDEVNLADWGMRWHRRGLLERIVDPAIREEIRDSSLRKFGETAAKCLRECGCHRPAMADVVWDLQYALQLQQSAAAAVGEPFEDSSTMDDSRADFPTIGDLMRLPSESLPFEDSGARDNSSADLPTMGDLQRLPSGSLPFEDSSARDNLSADFPTMGDLQRLRSGSPPLDDGGDVSGVVGNDGVDERRVEENGTGRPG